MSELVNDQRAELLRKFGAMLVGQLNHPAICGNEPFQLIARPDGFMYGGTAGYRVAQIRLNCGLRNAELAKALTPEKLAFFVPWELETPPVAYLDPTALKYVTVEAAFPTKPVNLQKTKVTLHDAGQFPDKGTHFITGNDMTGQTVTIPYRYLIHVLGAGTTGSGKSTMLSSAIYQTQKANSNAALNNLIVLATGKMSAAFAKVNGVLGQQGPLATNDTDIINALGWAVALMNERYRVLEKTNKLVDQPAVHIFFDEFQELTEDARHPVVTELVRQLVIKGRECGLHVWATTHKATLRMFGKAGNALKGQFSTTIGLQMPDAVSSRVLRGDDTCVHLFGRGDARVKAEIDGAVIDTRVQMAYVPESELEAVTGHPPVLEAWPEFDMGQLDRSLNRSGRPTDNFSDEQLACGIWAAQQINPNTGKPLGRPELAKLVAREATAIGGSGRLDRLLKKGRNIAQYLEELDDTRPEEIDGIDEL